jgi:hypothetical protein
VLGDTSIKKGARNTIANVVVVQMMLKMIATTGGGNRPEGERFLEQFRRECGNRHSTGTSMSESCVCGYDFSQGLIFLSCDSFGRVTPFQ